MGYFHEVEDTDKLENGWKHKYYVLFEEYKHEKQRLMDKADYDARCLKEMDDKLEAAYKALRRERGIACSNWRLGTGVGAQWRPASRRLRTRCRGSRIRFGVDRPMTVWYNR